MAVAVGSEEVMLQAGWAQPCQPPCAVLSYFGRGVTPRRALVDGEVTAHPRQRPGVQDLVLQEPR